MPQADGRLELRWRLLAAAVVAIGAVAAAFAVPAHAEAALAVGALGLVALHAWDHPDRVAWWWGFLAPIDFVRGVPGAVFDVARYGGVVWLVLVFAADLSPPRRPVVVRLAALVAAVGVIRGSASVIRADRFGMFIAAVMVVGAVSAPFVAWRVRSHVHVLAGFLGGVLLSAVVSLMQALDVPTLRDGNQSGERFPGLASTTMLITWHLAFALIIAVFFLARRDQPRLYRASALALVPLGLAALVVNGAQGGLLGLGLAALVVGLWGWRQVDWRRVAPYALGAFAVLVLVGVVLAVGHVRTPTIDGIRGKGDYTNELARYKVNKAGLEVMLEHPVAGVGRTNFTKAHGNLAPHFLPLEAGITAGIVAFAVAMYLLWCVVKVLLKGPVGRRPEAWLGLALTAAMFGNTLTETGGPFTGLPRFSLLLISVVAAQGEAWPSTSDPGEEATAEAEATSA